MTPEELIVVIKAFVGDTIGIPIRVSFDLETDGLWRVNWIGRGTTNAVLSVACQEFADALLGELGVEVEEGTAELDVKQRRYAQMQQARQKAP